MVIPVKNYSWDEDLMAAKMGRDALFWKRVIEV